MAKTAMQEWVEWIKAYEYELPLELQIKSKELLVLEKQNIIDAFEIGYNNGACVQDGKSIYHGNNYYNQTFKKE